VLAFRCGLNEFRLGEPSIRDELAPIPGAKRVMVAWIWYPAGPADYVGAFFDVYLKGNAVGQLQALAGKYPQVRIQ
jgi:hypothetical protein